MTSAQLGRLVGVSTSARRLRYADDQDVADHVWERVEDGEAVVHVDDCGVGRPEWRIRVDTLPRPDVTSSPDASGAPPLVT